MASTRDYATNKRQFGVFGKLVTELTSGLSRSALQRVREIVDERQLRHWKSGQRRPRDWDQLKAFSDIICPNSAIAAELFRSVSLTPPDATGKRDFSHLTQSVANHVLETMFPRGGDESDADLFERMRNAESEITVFGFTRWTFAARPEMAALLEEKSRTLPVSLFLMHPECPSRADRYRIEPPQAAFRDPQVFVREVVGMFQQLLKRASLRRRNHGSLRIFFYNFPCSIAIEKIDDTCRVMFYGHNKLGTQSPVLVFRSGNPYFDYFNDQLSWLCQAAVNGVPELYRHRGIEITPLDPSVRVSVVNVVHRVIVNETNEAYYLAVLTPPAHADSDIRLQALGGTARLRKQGRRLLEELGAHDFDNSHCQFVVNADDVERAMGLFEDRRNRHCFDTTPMPQIIEGLCTARPLGFSSVLSREDVRQIKVAFRESARQALPEPGSGTSDLELSGIPTRRLFHIFDIKVPLAIYRKMLASKTNRFLSSEEVSSTKGGRRLGHTVDGLRIAESIFHLDEL